MKKHLLIVIALMLPTFASVAQITINRSDLGNFINSYVIHANDSTNLNLLSAGAPGANQTWDLTGLGNDYLDTMKFLSPDSSYCASSFPTANIAGIQSGNFFFMQEDNSKLDMLGYCGVLMAPDTSVVPYNPPQTQATFPSTYNTTFNGQTTFKLRVAYTYMSLDSIGRNSYLTYSSLMDGWGSVTTPLGTFTCLRQKMVKYQTDSSFVHIAGAGWMAYGTPAVDTSIEYSWWSQHNPFIADITTSWNGAVKSANYMTASTLGIHEKDNNTRILSLYPNPTNGNITLDAGSGLLQNGKVEIYNLLGDKVYETLFSDKSSQLLIDLSNVSGGVYFLKLKTEKETIVKKFVKE